MFDTLYVKSPVMTLLRTGTFKQKLKFQCKYSGVQQRESVRE